MAIFFQTYFTNIVLVFSLYNFLYAAYTSFSGYLATADFLTRLNANDALISSFYFFWTNFVYLPTFFFFFFLITLLVSFFSKFRIALWLLIPIWLAYNVELLDYTLLSLHPSLGTYGSTDLNPLLSNSLNRYHPAVFYLSVSLAFVFLLKRVIVIYQKVEQNVIPAGYPDQLLALSAVVINLTALWMGSWWALQEGTWGGWWNWDPSEMFGLLFTFIMVWFLHSTAFSKFSVWPYIKATVSLCGLLQAYFFIQLNFDLVSHNFGSKFFFFFNHNLFFLEGLALTSWIILSTFQLQSWVTSRTVIQGSVTSLAKPFQHRVLIWLALVGWLLYSYQGLLSYFAWNFAGLTILNGTYTLWMSHIALLLVFLTWFNPFKNVHLVQPTLLLATGSFDLAAISAQMRLRIAWQFLSHSLLLFLAYHINFYGDLDSVTWASVNSLVLANEGSSLILRPAELIVLESASWEETRVFTTGNLTSVSYWQNFSFSNISIVNPFLLLASHTNFTNFYFLSQTYVFIFLDLKIITAPISNLLFLIFISMFIWAMGRRLY